MMKDLKILLFYLQINVIVVTLIFLCFLICAQLFCLKNYETVFMGGSD